MASATQIRAAGVARQAVLSATSPLKLFAAASAQSDALGAAASGSIFSSFENALNAARRPPSDGSQPRNFDAANSGKQADAPSQDHAESHAAAKSHSDSTAAPDAKTQVKKSRHHGKAVASDEDGQNSAVDAAGDEDSTTASASSENAPTAAPPATDNAKPTADKKVADDKDKTAAPPDPNAPSPTADAIAVSQQIVPATTPAPAVASTKKISPPEATAAPTATTPALPTVAASAQPAGKGTGKTEAAKSVSPPLAAAATKPDPKNVAPVANQTNGSAEAPTPAAAPAETAIKDLARTRAAKESAADTVAAPGTSTSAPSTSTASQSIPNAMQLVQQVVANLSAAPSAAAAQAGAAQGANHDAPKSQVTGITTISGTPASAVSAADESAEAAAPAQQVPDGDQDQTFQQVIQGLRGKMDPTNGKAEIRLDPPNLGTLHVSITLTNGSLTAQFQSSSDVVRDLLKSNMEKLKSVLEGQGVSVDKLAVEAPAGKVVAAAAKGGSSGAPNNNGRSAGQYTRDQQPGQKRSQNSASFARLWNFPGATATEDAPIDVVG